MASSTAIPAALVRVKSILHRGGSMVLPAALIVMGGGLLAYRRATSEGRFHEDPLCTFIALIVVQMVPLVFLEVKILHHDNPVGIMCRFGTNVALMHVIFLAVRFSLYCYYGNQGTIWPLWCLFLVLIAAVFVLVQGYKLSIAKDALFLRMRDVWLLVCLAVVAAIILESLPSMSTKRMCQGFHRDRYYACVLERSWKNLDIFSLLHSACNFIEILAFVPACLQISREASQKKQDDRSCLAGGTEPTWASSFFVFLIVLYFIEDVGTAFLHITTEPIASVTHVVHFLLVLDFSIFVLGEIYDSAKLKAHLMEWLPEALQCSAMV